MFSLVLVSGMFLEVVEGLEEACVSLYGILFDCTWTTVDSKDGAVGVGGISLFIKIRDVKVKRTIAGHGNTVKHMSGGANYVHRRVNIQI